MTISLSVPLFQILGPLLTWSFFTHVSPFGPLPVAEDSLLWIALSYFAHGAIFELVFWSGYFLEHLVPALYRRFHLLHHTTKADIAFSGTRFP